MYILGMFLRLSLIYKLKADHMDREIFGEITIQPDQVPTLNPLILLVSISTPQCNS